MGVLQLEPEQRQQLWAALVAALEDFAGRVGEVRVAPELALEGLRRRLEAFDFARPLPPLEALRLALDGLWRDQVHTPHPRYFGLFNPAPTTMGIAADTLVAAFNPQLAAWSHSPFAVEVERHLVRSLGARFGLGEAEGTFCTGGAEANQTALLVSLFRSFPEAAVGGLHALPAPPVLYASREVHHSVHKAARMAGLGTDSVREVATDSRWRMDPEALRSALGRDRRRGLAPFLVVATVGTTGAGAIDPVPALAELAHRERLWLHVDAAWGGAAALVPELAEVMEGVDRADSVTFDAHKWLSVPMGAGVFLTRHRGALLGAFRIPAGYMPREAEALGVDDPYACSVQWSRRFAGLKLFLSLLVAGWDGYASALRHQAALGRELRQRLLDAGWPPVNDTPLPLVCFVDGRREGGGTLPELQRVCDRVVASGAAWVSTTVLGGARPALRACITNHLTQSADLEALVAALDQAREEEGSRE